MYINNYIRLALAGQHPVESRALHRERKNPRVTILSGRPGETWPRHLERGPIRRYLYPCRNMCVHPKRRRRGGWRERVRKPGAKGTDRRDLFRSGFMPKQPQRTFERTSHQPGSRLRGR